MASNNVCYTSNYLSSMAVKAKQTSAKLLAFQEEADTYLKHTKDQPRLDLTVLRLQTVAADLRLLAQEAQQLQQETLDCRCHPCIQQAATKVNILNIPIPNSVFSSNHIVNITPSTQCIKFFSFYPFSSTRPRSDFPTGWTSRATVSSNPAVCLNPLPSSNPVTCDKMLSLSISQTTTQILTKS
jgi:hypothetical protein